MPAASPSNKKNTKSRNLDSQIISLDSCSEKYKDSNFATTITMNKSLHKTSQLSLRSGIIHLNTTNINNPKKNTTIGRPRQYR